MSFKGRLASLRATLNQLQVKASSKLKERKDEFKEQMKPKTVDVKMIKWIEDGGLGVKPPIIEVSNDVEPGYVEIEFHAPNDTIQRRRFVVLKELFTPAVILATLVDYASRGTTVVSSVVTEGSEAIPKLKDGFLARTESKRLLGLTEWEERINASASRVGSVSDRFENFEKSSGLRFKPKGPPTDPENSDGPPVAAAPEMLPETPSVDVPHVGDVPPVPGLPTNGLPGLKELAIAICKLFTGE